jgi:solute carrier family 12 (sodium/potassium/chloride transporter), member 2
MMDRWRAKLTVIAVVEKEVDKEKAKKFLARLVDLARLPAVTMAHVADDDFGRFAGHAPEADLNIFPLLGQLNAEFLWRLRDATGSSCLFTQDSGDESALK